MKNVMIKIILIMMDVQLYALFRMDTHVKLWLIYLFASHYVEMELLMKDKIVTNKFGAHQNVML